MDNLAPINSKSGAGSIAKRGAGIQGKSPGGKSNKFLGFGGKSDTKPSGKSSGLPSLGSSGKSGGLPSLGSSGKSSEIPSSSTSRGFPSSYEYPKANKSKTAFGILWIPTKKHNRHKKDMVYNPHRDDRAKDRSPSMYNLMSGDSHAQTHKKREEEASTLLVSDRPRAPAATTVAIASATAAAEATQTEPAEPDEKEKTSFIQRDNDENKEASGDSNGNGKEYLENNGPGGNLDSKSSEDKWEKTKFADKVDSVYLRPPPPHKTRSNASTAEDHDDCGIKCLYYTLQCCDCVLM